MAVKLAGSIAEELTRDSARDAAREELSKGKYQEAKPGLVEQLTNKAFDYLQEGLHQVGGAVPGGAPGLILLALLLVGLVVVIRLRTGPLSRSARVDDPFAEFARARSPAEHRRLADRHEAAGEFAEAVRERLRAIVRDLEERVIIEPRLGRTADEVAGEAGAALPSVAAELHRAARTFDDVWYGGRRATAAMAADLRLIDERVQAARPAAPAPAPPAQLAVPR